MKFKITKESNNSKNPVKEWKIECKPTEVQKKAIELARAKPFNKTMWLCTISGGLPENKLWFLHYGKKLPRTILISIIGPKRTQEEINEANLKYFRSLTRLGDKEANEQNNS